MGVRATSAVVAIVLLLAGCSDSKRIESSGGASSTTESSAATSSTDVTDSTDPGASTSVLVVDTTVAPTSPPTAPPPTAPPATAAPEAAELGPAVNLFPTPDTDYFLDATFACEYDPGFPTFEHVLIDCQQMPSYQDGLMTMVVQAPDGAFELYVFFLRDDVFRPLYQAYEPAAGTWSAVTVVLGDFNGDDGAEVWVGFRYLGTGQYLDFEVLDPRPDGSVFLGGIPSLEKGTVDLRPGGGVVRAALYGPSDPTCCPQQVSDRPLSFSGGVWRVGMSVNFPAATPPELTPDL